MAEGDNNLTGIYNTHVDSMSAELTDASAQPKPQNVTPPVFILQKQHAFGHALRGSLTMLRKPLPAGLIRASQLSRGQRRETLSSLDAEVELF